MLRFSGNYWLTHPTWTRGKSLCSLVWVIADWKHARWLSTWQVIPPDRNRAKLLITACHGHPRSVVLVHERVLPSARLQWKWYQNMGIYCTSPAGCLIVATRLVRKTQSCGSHRNRWNIPAVAASFRWESEFGNTFVCVNMSFYLHNLYCIDGTAGRKLSHCGSKSAKFDPDFVWLGN